MLGRHSVILLQDPLITSEPEPLKEDQPFSIRPFHWNLDWALTGQLWACKINVTIPPQAPPHLLGPVLYIQSLMRFHTRSSKSFREAVQEEVKLCLHRSWVGRWMYLYLGRRKMLKGLSERCYQLSYTALAKVAKALTSVNENDLDKSSSTGTHFFVILTWRYCSHCVFILFFF